MVAGLNITIMTKGEAYVYPFYWKLYSGTHFLAGSAKVWQTESKARRGAVRAARSLGSNVRVNRKVRRCKGPYRVAG